MTDTVTGAINNGAVGVATIGDFTGTVGVSRQPGARLAQIALRGKFSARKPPATGTLDGKPFAILSIKRSETDQQMTVVAIECAE